MKRLFEGFWLFKPMARTAREKLRVTNATTGDEPWYENLPRGYPDSAPLFYGKRARQIDR